MLIVDFNNNDGVVVHIYSVHEPAMIGRLPPTTTTTTTASPTTTTTTMLLLSDIAVGRSRTNVSYV